MRPCDECDVVQVDYLAELIFMYGRELDAADRKEGEVHLQVINWEWHFWPGGEPADKRGWWGHAWCHAHITHERAHELACGMIQQARHQASCII